MQSIEEQFRNLGYGTTTDDTVDVNTQEVLESITANSGTTTKGHGGKDTKFVFRHTLSHERAQQLIETLMCVNEGTTLTYGEYKNKILNECNIISVYKESAIEMLIYGSKGIKNEQYKVVLLDVLRTLKTKDATLIDSYKHILATWTWEDCLELTISSVSDLHIKEVAPMLYEIYEKNDRLRIQAAKALIDIDAQEFFPSMINYLASRPNDQVKEKDEFSDIMKYFAQNHPQGSQFVYDTYVHGRYPTSVLNMLIVGIRGNLTPQILQNIERVALDTTQSKFHFEKMLRILERSNKSPLAQRSLENIKKSTGINRPKFYENDCDKLIKLATNPQLPIKDRMNAVILLAPHNDDRIPGLLEHFKLESPHMCIVAASCNVERGYDEDLKLLFNYILKDETQCDIEYTQEAIYQIRRLRGIIGTNSQKVHDTLERLINTLLQPGKLRSVKIEMRLIELYSKGVPSENLGRIFLSKLQTSQSAPVLQLLLRFFEQHRDRFNTQLQEQSLAEIIRLSKNTVVSKEAMETLNAITRTKNKELVI